MYGVLLVASLSPGTFSIDHVNRFRNWQLKTLGNLVYSQEKNQDEYTMRLQNWIEVCDLWRTVEMLML
jgi:hypothetical protein